MPSPESAGPEPDPAVDWDAAIAAHNRRVLLSLVALGLSIDEAEEVANQAWMRLIEQHRHGRLADIRLPGLAVRQARFLGLNRRKAAAEEARARAPVGEAEALASGGLDPEESLLVRVDVRRALDVLSSCSKSAQAVFHQIYDDPPPRCEDVARRLGLSVQRVRQILCEVRKKLRAAVESNP